MTPDLSKNLLHLLEKATALTEKCDALSVKIGGVFDAVKSLETALWALVGIGAVMLFLSLTRK